MPPLGQLPHPDTLNMMNIGQNIGLPDPATFMHAMTIENIRSLAEQQARSLARQGVAQAVLDPALEEMQKNIKKKAKKVKVKREPKEMDTSALLSKLKKKSRH